MDIIKSCGVAVGAIIITWAAIKLTIALADENVVERTKASLMLGVGIFFTSITAVLTTVLGSGGKISSATTAEGIAGNVVGLLGTLMTFSGAAMMIFAIFSYIMALTNEDASQKAKASSSILISIGLLTAHTVCDAIKTKISSGTTDGTSYVSDIVSWIGAVATYAGGGMAVMAIFQIIMSVKDEDGKGRSEGIKLLLVAIALVSFPRILHMIGLS